METVLKMLAEILSMKFAVNFKASLHKSGKLSKIVETIINVSLHMLNNHCSVYYVFCLRASRDCKQLFLTLFSIEDIWCIWLC